MHSNYRRLGHFIRLVDERNRDLAVTKLLGVSIQKKLMPSIANIVGTDMSSYKIIRKNQFAYGTVTSRNGEKVSIAILKNYEKAIVSQIYLVFEIIDQNLLSPDYLMMWFRRPEFDRYARFKSHGSARETFDWSEMCDVELPVPSIEKQRELVAEYEAVERRIRINEQLCQKLEETAQTIYRHWFEDFEFPVTKNSLDYGVTLSAVEAPQVAEPESAYTLQTGSRQPSTNTQPYKSSGGEMEYNEELGKEIPKGWKVGKVKEFCIEMKNGATPSRDNIDFWKDGTIPWIKTGEIDNNIIIEAEEFISEEGFKNRSTKWLPKDTVLMAMYGATASKLAIIKFPATTNQACCGMICNNEYDSAFLYFSLLNFQSEIKAMANGGAQENISKNIIEDLKIIFPSKNVINNSGFKKIVDKLEQLIRQTQKLQELKILLLGKMAVEN